MPKVIDSLWESLGSMEQSGSALALTILPYFPWLSWCSFSTCCMNEIRDYALTVKNILFNRLPNPRFPKFRINKDPVCVCENNLVSIALPFASFPLTKMHKCSSSKEFDPLSPHLCFGLHLSLHLYNFNLMVPFQNNMQKCED